MLEGGQHHLGSDLWFGTGVDFGADCGCGGSDSADDGRRSPDHVRLLTLRGDRRELTKTTSKSFLMIVIVVVVVVVVLVITLKSKRHDEQENLALGRPTVA